ncbi:RelA/SpoT family protein [Solemya velum gill symbiont]|uniref:RelA/SpoT family protein n=2 Tax=Solemya velum gill symbiont TaxID=2340 RepID=UPI001E3FC741|nr:bifunctional (p)ppGpp synthetase/guanosine-3',5'-bis(diphosphate) 3'-pyrophosphohydrolase [Solemya velum gill symbiont]
MSEPKPSIGDTQLDMPLHNEKRQPDLRFLISDLTSYLETYLPQKQVSEIYRAYLFGADAHINQKRLSGEPYIYHPIAVSHILATMRMDHKCIMAAMLHDVIEDTPTAKSQLHEQFDEEVAELVDGVTKLTSLDFSSREEAQAASFQKMILAMTKDIRVILIKLADRLHNMRTLGVMRPEKARRIASETLEIYAPIAQRLGISRLRHELEDLAFQAHWPMRYRILREAVVKHHGFHKELTSGTLAAIRGQLMREKIHADVVYREKHLFSVYRKMRDRKVSFSEIADVVGFRIIVDDVDACYRALGSVHHVYAPRPGRFKDYIAIPKASGYQALHTVLVGPHGGPIEVQIRTQAMDQVAESGVAAHWNYKSGEAGSSTARNSIDWLKNLLDVQKDSANPMEFLENVKLDLFPGEVYVFTPKGKIIVLPKGSTIIDFAYAVHSQVGNHCVAARIDQRMVPLKTRLHNGETIEIHTAEKSRPNPRWLDFAVTSKARASIRSYLKNLQRQDAVQLGAQLLAAELQLYGGTLEKYGQQAIEEIREELGYSEFDDLLADVGLGNRPARLVAKRLADGVVEEGDAGSGGEAQPLAAQRVNIRGTEGMVVSYARCCHPIPGDPIIGTFHPGRGIVVHHATCPNISDMRKYPENWVDVAWESSITGSFPVVLRVEASNQPGVLATVASAIADAGSNIESIRTDDYDGRISVLIVTLSVHDRRHLSRLMKNLRHVPVVNRLTRMIG